MAKSSSSSSSSSNELTDTSQLKSAVNPASFNSYPMFLREILKSAQISIDTVMPATVVTYDRKKHFADVQPLVKRIYNTTEGDKYRDRGVVSVPVFRMQHGMFWVDAPLYKGDTGFLVAGHRDSSLAVEANSSPVLTPERNDQGTDVRARTNNNGTQPPSTYLLHEYGNGFFVPCRFGEIAVDDADRDAMVIARFKENEEQAKKGIYETDGVEGKITFAANGDVRILNGTGLTVASDETYEEEDEDGNKTSRQKPKAIIDPTADLVDSDARFRTVTIPTSGGYVDSDGNTHVPTKKVRILADDSSEAGDDIVLKTSESEGGGGLTTKVDDVNLEATSYLDDVPVSTTKTWNGKTINLGITLGTDPDEETDPREEGGEDYCNSISDEAGGGGGGGGESEVDNDISDDDSSLGNGISYTPCDTAS